MELKGAERQQLEKLKFQQQRKQEELFSDLLQASHGGHWTVEGPYKRASYFCFRGTPLRGCSSD